MRRLSDPPSTEGSLPEPGVAPSRDRDVKIEPERDWPAEMWSALARARVIGWAAPGAWTAGRCRWEARTTERQPADGRHLRFRVFPRGERGLPGVLEG